jgi:hypothetical protein
MTSQITRKKSGANAPVLVSEKEASGTRLRGFPILNFRPASLYLFQKEIA